jgi:tetratricopeptide (TPR) repeat protein
MFLVGVLGILTAGPLAAQEKPRWPTQAEVQALLKQEPITEATWPAWRQRLSDWFGDASLQTDPAYKAAQRFLNSMADAGGRLPPQFNQDHLAWYLLGDSYMHQQPPRSDANFLAEIAYRRCIAIEPKFARGHRNLAMVIVFQAEPAVPGTPVINPRLEEADRECAETLRLDPALPMVGIDALVALRRGQYSRAAGLYEKALERDPHNAGLATDFAESVVFDAQVKNPSARIRPLVERFPHNGKLSALFALSLWIDSHPSAAYEELQRAKELGVDVAQILRSQGIVERIEQEGKPGLLDAFAKIVVVLAVLVVAGLVAWRVWHKYVRASRVPV